MIFETCGAGALIWFGVTWKTDHPDHPWQDMAKAIGLIAKDAKRLIKEAFNSDTP